MLDYSGNLLWGLHQMGREDVLIHLKRITCDPLYQPHVEWLGTMWSHAVVPSTPIPDLKLQIQAWQQYFAAIFGIDALKRVKGFSPARDAPPQSSRCAVRIYQSPERMRLSLADGTGTFRRAFGWYELTSLR